MGTYIEYIGASKIKFPKKLPKKKMLKYNNTHHKQ